MKLYPAIDLREGATVQLVGGDPSKEHVHHPDPVKVAHRWFGEGATFLHLVDLDAALGKGDNLHVVKRILQAVPCPIQVGGGVRHLVDIQRLMDHGVGRVIIGTQGIRNPDWFEIATDIYPDRLLLAIDARGDEVTVSGWQEESGIRLDEVLERVAGLPLAGLLYTNVDVEGRLEGIDEQAVARVVDATDHPVVASGGITTLEDLDTLKGIGVDAAVLGMSIYTGRIDLPTAIEKIEGRRVKRERERERHVMIPPSEVQWGTVPPGAPDERILGNEAEEAARNGPQDGHDTENGHRQNGDAGPTRKRE
jgi:phosphoribosylformimino-5-aminoimidazole carboxamide ribotide isomerase